MLCVLYCLVDGEWSDWGPWSDCTRSCGAGIRARNRECNNPAPQHGGNYCAGFEGELEGCNTQPCPGKPHIIHIKWFDVSSITYIGLCFNDMQKESTLGLVAKNVA